MHRLSPPPPPPIKPAAVHFNRAVDRCHEQAPRASVAPSLNVSIAVVGSSDVTFFRRGFDLCPAIYVTGVEVLIISAFHYISLI